MTHPASCWYVFYRQCMRFSTRTTGARNADNIRCPAALSRLGVSLLWALFCKMHDWKRAQLVEPLRSKHGRRWFQVLQRFGLLCGVQTYAKKKKKACSKNSKQTFQPCSRPPPPVPSTTSHPPWFHTRNIGTGGTWTSRAGCRRKYSLLGGRRCRAASVVCRSPGDPRACFHCSNIALSLTHFVYGVCRIQVSNIPICLWYRNPTRNQKHRGQ